MESVILNSLYMALLTFYFLSYLLHTALYGYAKQVFRANVR